MITAAKHIPWPTRTTCPSWCIVDHDAEEQRLDRMWRRAGGGADRTICSHRSAPHGLAEADTIALERVDGITDGGGGLRVLFYNGMAEQVDLSIESARTLAGVFGDLIEKADQG